MDFPAFKFTQPRGSGWKHGRVNVMLLNRFSCFFHQKHQTHHLFAYSLFFYYWRRWHDVVTLDILFLNSSYLENSYTIQVLQFLGLSLLLSHTFYPLMQTYVCSGKNMVISNNFLSNFSLSQKCPFSKAKVFTSNHLPSVSTNYEWSPPTNHHCSVRLSVWRILLRKGDHQWEGIVRVQLDH